MPLVAGCADPATGHATPGAIVRWSTSTRTALAAEYRGNTASGGTADHDHVTRLVSQPVAEGLRKAGVLTFN
ncbi:hypothetical protein [Actinomadura sp. 21ATH]|uniref:hypothetical protein n=1 Tax=Actinomadura sp. 21ATH TaxID=1735444 RepID=UPI0035C09A1A